jgi:hypothetical protein
VAGEETALERDVGEFVVGEQDSGIARRGERERMAVTVGGEWRALRVAFAWL